MLNFVRIIFVVYILAINAYAFVLVLTRKKEEEELSEDECKYRPNNGKLFITGLLGGALGIYVSMFVFKYRLTSLLLMVFMPVLIAANGYLTYLLFSQNFGFIIEAPEILNAFLRFN